MAEAIFPVIPSEIPKRAVESIGRVPAFSFDSSSRKGTFSVVDGALRERNGIEAVKQWFELMLRQRPGVIPIYRTENTYQPGVDTTIVNDKRFALGFVYAEIERNVRDTSAFCPAVRTVDSFEFQRKGRTLQVNFTARMHTGETVEVSVDVNSE